MSLRFTLQVLTSPKAPKYSRIFSSVVSGLRPPTNIFLTGSFFIAIAFLGSICLPSNRCSFCCNTCNPQKVDNPSKASVGAKKYGYWRCNVISLTRYLWWLRKNVATFPNLMEWNKYLVSFLYHSLSPPRINSFHTWFLSANLTELDMNRSKYGYLLATSTMSYPK